MVPTYNENKAEAKEILNNLNKEFDENILYAEDFICGKSGHGNKFSTAILTDRNIYIVYNTDKLIFEESLDNIKSIEIHFLDNNFIICFLLKNWRKRGFRVHKDFSKIPTELFDLISSMVEKINISNMISKRTLSYEQSIFGNIIPMDDDNIDESSYTHTITQNTAFSVK